MLKRFVYSANARCRHTGVIEMCLPLVGCLCRQNIGEQFGKFIPALADLFSSGVGDFFCKIVTVNRSQQALQLFQCVGTDHQHAIGCGIS